MSLALKDARVVYRDRFLLFICGYAFLLALVMRVGVPRVPIEHLDLYLAPAVAIFGASMFGMILGFALIEEKEQRTWLLLRVLPLPRLTLFSYLTGGATALSFVVALAAAAIYGLRVAELGSFLVMTLAASLTAPLGMAALAAVSANKIEGLAYAKILSSVSAVPALVFFLPPSWHPLLAWSPWYWIYLGLLRAYASEQRLGALAFEWPSYPAWCYPVTPVLMSLAVTTALLRLYLRRVE
jgi:fluoroquinolone transport system permease protein